MLGLAGWDVGFLWFSIGSVMETAGRFASKPGCHSTFVRCMPNTRQGVCRAVWLSRILCFRYILSWGQAVLRMLAYFWWVQCLQAVHLLCLSPFVLFPNLFETSVWNPLLVLAVPVCCSKAVLRCQSLSSLLLWPFSGRPMLKLEFL